jgi:hypothetical protein
MKKIMTMIFAFTILLCVRAFPQQPGDSRGISDNSSIKGKRLLNREMRSHKAAVTLAAKNEKKARKEHKLGTMNHHNSKAKQISRQNKKAQKKAEKGKGKSEETVENKGRD